MQDEQNLAAEPGRRTSFPLGIAQKIAAAALLAAAFGISFNVLFLRQVEGDFACYGLPAANWLQGGPFAVPQQGDQYGLDRLWRFNSPLLGGGAIPFFWIGEIGHDWYLLGCVLLLIASFAVYLSLCRAALGDRRWPAAAAVTVAFLTVRICLSECVNQRYSICAYPAVAWLFFPFARRLGMARKTQWWIAGLLPLIHPALALGSVVWVLAEFAAAARQRRMPGSPAGLAGFLVGVALNAIWYLDPEGLTGQFLPHLRSREFKPFSGWEQMATWKYALPSMLTMALAVVGLAAAWLAPAPARFSDCRPRMTALMAIVLILDTQGKMFYLSYYILGLAPGILASLEASRWQSRLVAAWCVLAVLQVAIEIKFTSQISHYPATRTATRNFLTAHTRPGDVIVVGPPFVLSAASDPQLPEGRRIAYVVPMPLFLKDFDAAAFLAMMRRDSTVYVGNGEYFKGIQRNYKLESEAVFEPSHIDTVDFMGMPVMIARPTASPPGK